MLKVAIKVNELVLGAFVTLIHNVPVKLLFMFPCYPFPFPSLPPLTCLGEVGSWQQRQIARPKACLTSSRTAAYGDQILCNGNSTTREFPPWIRRTGKECQKKGGLEAPVQVKASLWGSCVQSPTYPSRTGRDTNGETLEIPCQSV